MGNSWVYESEAKELFCPVPNFEDDTLGRAKCMGAACGVWAKKADHVDYYYWDDERHMDECEFTHGRYEYERRWWWFNKKNYVPGHDCTCTPEYEGKCGLRLQDNVTINRGR